MWRGDEELNDHYAIRRFIAMVTLLLLHNIYLAEFLGIINIIKDSHKCNIPLPTGDTFKTPPSGWYIILNTSFPNYSIP